jgi:hypothetical protein
LLKEDLMSRYKVALFAVISLAVFGLAVLLYWWSRPHVGLENPPLVEKPCKFLPNTANPEDDRDCYKRCGSPHEGGPVQATINGTTWLFCCPKGYSAGFDHEINDVKCYKN